MRTPFIGVTAQRAAPDILRERKLEARIEKKLNRRLNRLLEISKQLQRPWELVRIITRQVAQPITWKEFKRSRNLEVIVVARVEHRTIAAAYVPSLLGPRLRFYWCLDFPWSRLDEVQASHIRRWHKAEAAQHSSGEAFRDYLALAWGGRRFASLEELTKLENSSE